MDSESLRTASEYLNNLLLARGLLRNSDPIDFVKPSRESRAQIINLVHDLILRRDRDKEQRERTAIAYHQLRADEDGKNHEIERLQAKQEEAARSCTQAQTAERVAKEDLKKVEKSIRTLQEQGNKLKATLAQVKAQCTNDIRKRDLELARLKTHLQGQQRGNRSAAIAPSITITGGHRKLSFDTSARDVADPAYSLKQESNEFLTQLSQNLNDENDRLLNVVRGAVITLRELLGLQAVSMRNAADSGIGEDVTTGSRDKHPHTLPTSFDALADDLETALSHLKSLLTNPNFVSIEEVEIREDEIARMRIDWEKMEHRWRDLLAMMSGWRRRMDTGGIINKDDIRKGMGLVSPSHEQSETTITQAPAECSLVDDSISDGIDDSMDDGIDDSMNDIRKPTNEGRVSPKRKRDPLEPPESFDLRPRGVTQRARSSRAFDHDRARSTWMQVDVDGGAEAAESEELEKLEVPCLTIEQKLSAAAEDAAAAVAQSHVVSNDRLDGAADGVHDDDTLGRMSSLSKKSKIKGRPRRRKSTLSRDELAGLLADDA